MFERVKKLRTDNPQWQITATLVGNSKQNLQYT